MWYKSEAFGHSNQVHQLKLLQKITLLKNCVFCEDMSKIQKCNSCSINNLP